MASMEREQRALIKWCKDTSSRYLGCTEQIRNILVIKSHFKDLFCLHRNSSYWELSKSLDKILEITGRSVITAVVSTLGVKDVSCFFLPAHKNQRSILISGLLTVLGPSTALPGFRAPPAPGFNPKIHTRCLKKTVSYFRVCKDATNIIADKTKRKGRWKKSSFLSSSRYEWGKRVWFANVIHFLQTSFKHLKLNDLISAHMVMKGYLNVCI